MIDIHDLKKEYIEEETSTKALDGVSFSIKKGEFVSIMGPSGSGKSTLLQVISGAISHNEGKIEMIFNGSPILEENCFQYLSIAAPYLELIEEMTATEFLNFHASLKPLTHSTESILSFINLEKAAQKQIRYYSSGMKQRLKLAQAFFCSTPLLLLDEPTTNLDAEGIALYQQLIAEHSHQKLVIISSNDPQEYSFCDEVIAIANYK